MKGGGTVKVRVRVEVGSERAGERKKGPGGGRAASCLERGAVGRARRAGRECCRGSASRTNRRVVRPLVRRHRAVSLDGSAGSGRRPTVERRQPGARVPVRGIRPPRRGRHGGSLDIVSRLGGGKVGHPANGHVQPHVAEAGPGAANPAGRRELRLSGSTSARSISAAGRPAAVCPVRQGVPASREQGHWHDQLCESGFDVGCGGRPRQGCVSRTTRRIVSATRQRAGLGNPQPG